MTRMDAALVALRTGLSGRLIRQGDSDYDTARAVLYGGIDKPPVLIVRVASAADTQRVVDVARDTGLKPGVRSGGHSNAAHSTTDGVADWSSISAT